MTAISAAEVIDTSAATRYPCPSWCTLPAEHPWDSVPFDHGVLVRSHEGPNFGVFIKVCATERSNALGVMHPEVLLYDDDAVGDPSPSAVVLRGLAAQAIAAAEWLEAFQ